MGFSFKNIVIAGLIGSHSGMTGFVIHMIISLIFGVTFTVFVRFLPLNSDVSGVLYGIILWVLFPFILMPVMMGMKAMAFHISPDNLMSLLDHMMYGLITGIVYNMLSKDSVIQTKAPAVK